MATLNNNTLINEIDDFELASSYMCDPDQCSNYFPCPDDGSLKIVHMNIRSINKNFDEFVALLSAIKIEFDVIVLTECRLKKSSIVPSLDGYYAYATKNNPIQNDGVAVYVKNGIVCTVEEPNVADANCLVCKIQDTILINIYRSPSYLDLNNFYHSLEDLVNTIKTYKSIAIIGDLNVDIKPANTDSNSNNYLTFMSRIGFLPAHLLPTRLNNCLDHIFVNTKTPALALVVDTAVTDHNATILSLSQSIPKLKSKTHFSRTNYGNIQKELETVNFSSVLEELDANAATDKFIGLITPIIHKHTRCVRVSNKNRVIKPWITTGLLRCIRNRNKMHQKLRKSPNNETLKMTYRRYRNFCNALLRKLKRSYERGEFDKAKNNPKKTWDVIKKVTNTNRLSSSATELLKIDCNEKASINRVNQFFVSVGKTLASDITRNHDIEQRPIEDKSAPPNSLVILPVTEAQVERLIDALRISCATGYDSIPARVIKASRTVLVPPITHICNRSIASGTFPKAFKKALVTPIFKGGKKNHITNYRPISVLSSLSKILERIMNNSLVSYIEKYKLMSPYQYGFRSGRSTEDAIAYFTRVAAEKMDNKRNCYGVFLDLSKAFDTVSVPLLISKLVHLGVRGVALDIFRDYLLDRSQCVKIDSSVSEEESIEYGVPQGSILGPTLFTIYVNDLCQMQLRNCTLTAYADDTALLVYGNDWTDAKVHAENALRLVIKWLRNNLLTLNVEKTKVICFSLPNTRKPIEENLILKAHICSTQLNNCNCRPLETVSKIKYLGIYLDESLSWQAQIESLAARVRKLIFIFKTLRHSADSVVMRLVYLTLCQSVLSYCVPVWGSTYKTSMLTLERAQRAVLKVMYFKRYDYPTTKLYSECQFLSVRQLYIWRAILRRHSELPLDPSVVLRRPGTKVCPTLRCRTAFAQRQYDVLSRILYNKVNKLINIYSSNKHEVNRKLYDWLLTLDYSKTEDLLTRIT